MTSKRTHPQQAAIEALLKGGFTNNDVAAGLGVGHRAVARIRAELGIPPVTNATTEDEKYDRYASAPDAAGHVTWSGRSGHLGTPVIRQRQGGAWHEVPAAAIAFERRTGRPAAGICKADCDVKHCVAPDHVLDDIERRTVRLQLRSVHGLRGPWTECPEGHDWDDEGRVDFELTLYCKACRTDRARNTRDAIRDENGS